MKIGNINHLSVVRTENCDIEWERDSGLSEYSRLGFVPENRSPRRLGILGEEGKGGLARGVCQALRTGARGGESGQQSSVAHDAGRVKPWNGRGTMQLRLRTLRRGT